MNGRIIKDVRVDHADSTRENLNLVAFPFILGEMENKVERIKLYTGSFRKKAHQHC